MSKLKKLKLSISKRRRQIAKYSQPLLHKAKDLFDKYIVILDEDKPSESSKALSLQLGYFAEVSEKDVRVYANALAESNHVSKDLTYIGITPFLNGYAYEVHEGGPGIALLPDIIKEFENLQENINPDNPLQLYKRTTTRTVLIEVHQGGITAYMLPENRVVEDSPALVKGTTPLEKLNLNSVSKFFIASKFVGLAGFALLLLGVLFRPGVPDYTGVDSREAFSKKPVAQWKKLAENNTPGKTATLTYSKGNWSVIFIDDDTQKEGAKHD